MHFWPGKIHEHTISVHSVKSVVLLQHNACTIIQFSSGIYKVFHEKDADKEAVKSLASWFPAKCFLDVQLTTSGKKSFTASHNIIIFGDYFPSTSIEIKVGKIDSEFASGSYTLAEISKVNSTKERKIITLQYLFEHISYHWKTKTFLAKLNLNLQGPFTFQTSFHAWSGTWALYLIQSSETSFHLNQSLQFSAEGFDSDLMSSNLPLSDEIDNCLVVSVKINSPTAPVFIYSFAGVQIFDATSKLSRREWKSHGVIVMDFSKVSTLAAPGRFQKLLVFFHSPAQFHSLLLNAFDVYAFWLNVGPTRSKLVSINESQYGNYKMITKQSESYKAFWNKRLSWFEGLELCQNNFEGKLPQFVSRSSHDFFLNIFENF